MEQLLCARHSSGDEEPLCLARLVALGVKGGGGGSLGSQGGPASVDADSTRAGLGGACGSKVPEPVQGIKAISIRVREGGYGVRKRVHRCQG